MLFIFSHISIARNKFVCTSLTIFSYTLVSNNIQMFCLQVLLLTQYNLFCYLLDDEKCLTSLVEHFNFVFYILFICAGSYYGRNSLFLSIENNDNKKNLDCYCKQYKRGSPRTWPSFRYTKVKWHLYTCQNFSVFEFVLPWKKGNCPVKFEIF